MSTNVTLSWDKARALERLLAAGKTTADAVAGIGCVASAGNIRATLTRARKALGRDLPGAGARKVQRRHF